MDGADNIDKVVGEMATVNYMSDTDYQLDTATVTLQFTGFESTMHGVMQFEMAVGTEPNGEDVLAFTDANIIHLEELDPVGRGNENVRFILIGYYSDMSNFTNCFEFQS